MSAPDGPAPAPDPPREPTRDSIRGTALELFSTAGYSPTTMREIAAAVGIRAASLYNHFPAKEAILWDLAESALSDLARLSEAAEDGLGPDPSPARRLEAFVLAHTRFHATHQREAALINRQLRALSADHYAQAVASRNAYTGRLRRILSDGVEAGHMDVPDVAVVAAAILETGVGVSTWFRDGGRLGVEDLAALHALLAAKLTARRTTRRTTGGGPP